MNTQPQTTDRQGLREQTSHVWNSLHKNGASDRTRSRGRQRQVHRCLMPVGGRTRLRSEPRRNDASFRGTATGRGSPVETLTARRVPEVALPDGSTGSRHLAEQARPAPECRIIRVAGESMESRLADGCAILVNRASGRRRDNRIDLGLDVALALDADVLLQRHEGDARLGEGVEDGDDLTSDRPSRESSLSTRRSPRWRPLISSSSRQRFSEACPEAVAATGARSPGGGAATTGWVSRYQGLRACARQISPTGALGNCRRDPAVRRPSTGSRRRDDPRLRRCALSMPPSANGWRPRRRNAADRSRAGRLGTAPRGGGWRSGAGFGPYRNCTARYGTIIPTASLVATVRISGA